MYWRVKAIRLVRLLAPRWPRRVEANTSAATKAKMAATRKAHAAAKPKSTTGRHMSAAARAAESARMKGKSHPHAGHAITDATKAKISAALKARHPNGPAKRVGTGRHITAATKAKISAALKGHPRAKRTVAATRPTAKTAHHTTTPRTTRRRPLVKEKRVHIGRRKGLISSATHHSYKGRLHTKTRHHRYRPILRRKVRARRVWRKRRKA